MKLIHHITISVFVKDFEDKQQTAEALTSLLPKNFEEEKVLIQEEEAKIDKESNMKIYTVKLERQKHIKESFQILKDLLGREQCEKILAEESRIDEQGNLFIRIKRNDFEKEGVARLTDKGDCFHFKIVLAAYPKKKEKALEVVKRLFGE